MVFWSFFTFFNYLKSQIDWRGVKIGHVMCPNKFKIIEKGKKLNFLKMSMSGTLAQHGSLEVTRSKSHLSI